MPIRLRSCSLQLATCSQIINTVRIIEKLHAYPHKVLQLAACRLQLDFPTP